MYVHHMTIVITNEVEEKKSPSGTQRAIRPRSPHTPYTHSYAGNTKYVVERGGGGGGAGCPSLFSKSYSRTNEKNLN